MASPFARSEKIKTARDAVDYLQPFFLAGAVEKLAIVHLDTNQRIIDITEVQGCSVEVELPLRRVIAAALGAGASALILAHNHPSGDPAPSKADVEATQRLTKVAEPLGISIYDHLIFAGGESRSFRALGLL